MPVFELAFLYATARTRTDEMIRTASSADAAAIYSHYVFNTVITFEEQAVTTAQMAERILQVQQDGLPWLVIGGITLPNDASVALHEKFGFEKCGHFKQVGFKFGQWRDLGYWQRLLLSL